MIFTGSLTSDLIGILIGLLVCIITFYKWSFTYWKKKGVTVPYPPSIPFGNLADLFLGRSSFGNAFKKFYDKLKEDKQRFGGVYMFANPVFIPVDTELIKRIMQSDFQYFVNHGTFANENDPLSVHLFNMADEEWKEWRIKLTPTFTTGKMKMMLDTMVETTHGLNDLLEEIAKSKAPVEIKGIVARFTTDVIGSCAFGIECNSLKNPESQFRRYGRRAVEDITIMEHVKNFLQFVLPHNVYSFLKLRVTNREVEHFFMNVVEKTVEYREKNEIFRKDFMHLLLQLKNQGKVTDDEKFKDRAVSQSHLSIDQVAAQCFLFFLAGFETSSTTITFALYELAKNQQIQDKLRHEIKTVLTRHNNKITYEALMEMNYLEKIIHDYFKRIITPSHKRKYEDTLDTYFDNNFDLSSVALKTEEDNLVVKIHIQVFNIYLVTIETLRKYPPLPTLFRTCSRDYAVPGSSLIIKKGTQVQIPIFGIQKDPEYYPDPERFDPERFTEENKNQRPPFTWIPFGEGPRVCIGLRFGMMQSKIGIATVILNNKITVNSKTQEPIEYKSTGFITAAQGGIWLNLEKIAP